MKDKFKYRSIIVGSILLSMLACNGRYESDQSIDKLKVDFKGDANIEIGSAYAGLEFHHSSCLPQRISFYYPVANSIDMSTDFWHRDTSYIMALGIKTGDGQKEFIDPKNCNVSFTPFMAEFSKVDSIKTVEISYKFTKNKPAFVVTYEITNNSKKTKEFELYTLLEASFRTSHTFAMVDKAWSEYDENRSAMFINFDDKATGQTQLFAINTGEKPVSYSTISTSVTTPHVSSDEWINNEKLSEDVCDRDNPRKPAIKYLYKKQLKPNESLIVSQVIGTCPQQESEKLIKYLRSHSDKEVENFEKDIIRNIEEKNKFKTGDDSIDKSAMWATSMLEVNKHYIDGDIVPMPCPAEYNFYFTHDVLVTDLAAVNFDIARVEDDLKFIMKHSSSDFVIPHAYYWKDSTFATEYADRDNWNNYWINIVAANYLRHSNNKELLKELYPYLTRSITNALKNLGKDSLMWSFRPDWWDIGKKYGSKTYMTALAVKTIEEYVFISNELNENTDRLLEYEYLAEVMKNNLVKYLWSNERKFLVNYYEPGKIDTHYYIGSLLAAYYGMLDANKTTELLNTADKQLLDPNIGVYNAYPMDYDSLGEYLGFVGNEAGGKHYYFNGGVWPQGNAWYALALIKNDNSEQAYNFIKNVMTLDGIINGPNGQPAMYEVRNSNKDNPKEYGTVDKPNFMWAGAWYLKSLYNLFLLKDNSWNITMNPFLPSKTQTAQFSLQIKGRKTDINIAGQGKYVSSIQYDGKEYPSLAVPEEIQSINEVDIRLGKLSRPILTETNSTLISVHSSEDSLLIKLKAFKGHKSSTELLSPMAPQAIIINNPLNNSAMTFQKEQDVFRIRIEMIHTKSDPEEIIVVFTNK